MARKRPRIPQPDQLYKDANDLGKIVKDASLSRVAWEQGKDEQIDTLVSLLKREGVPERRILEVFGDVDPTNRLNWYKHFFR